MNDGNPFIEEIEIIIRQEVQAGMSDYWQDDQEESFYEGLLDRGNGDPDTRGYPGQPTVEHVIEPENGLWADMLQDVDLPTKLKRKDVY